MQNNTIGGIDVDFIITIILWILIILFLLNEVIIRVVGDAIVNMKASEHTPFTVDEITQDSISLSTTINVANEGKQCATIMDCYVRQLLPYEQFDGVKVEAKAELKGVPREDDYFEAVLIQKKESIDIVIRVKLIDRKTMISNKHLLIWLIYHLISFISMLHVTHGKSPKKQSCLHLKKLLN